MDYLWLPTAILVYLEIGGLIAVVSFYIWTERARTRWFVHALFFPRHTLRGRNNCALPPIDWVVHQWRYSTSNLWCGVVVAVYAVCAIALGPLRIVWLPLCLAFAILEFTVAVIVSILSQLFVPLVSYIHPFVFSFTF